MLIIITQQVAIPGKNPGIIIQGGVSECKGLVLREVLKYFVYCEKHRYNWDLMTFIFPTFYWEHILTIPVIQKKWLGSKSYIEC